MNSICKKLDKSRAAFYKHQKGFEKVKLNEKIIRDLTMEKRKAMPRLGGKKTYHEIRVDLQKHGIKLGRDKYFNWLREEQLLVQPKKKYVYTTQSFHRFRKYENLIQGLHITAKDQVWVSDITYLRLHQGFCYLALVTDVYSRKIIGFNVSDSLQTEGVLNALNMALKTRKGANTIHHSDRGFQYCSYAYIKRLKKASIGISMGEVGNCYENALAERVNGILKNEFNLDVTFPNIERAKHAVSQAVHTYNSMRPHMSIAMKKPSEVYAA